MFQGYYRTATDTSTVVLSDGREMEDSEFQILADSNSPDRTTCLDCDCAYLNVAGNLVWAQCSENHRYLCEYKGT